MNRPTTDAARLDAIVDAVYAFLDVAVSRHPDTRADEVFIECHVCGGWEEHTDQCPVPLAEKWLSATPATKEPQHG